MRRGVLRRVVRLVAVTLVATGGVELGAATPTLPGRFEKTPITEPLAVERLQQATVEAFALGCDLALRQGTAVVIAAGRVATNEHVVGAFRSVEVAADGQPVTPASSVQVGATADIAVIQAGGLAAQPLALAPDDPVPGEPVRLAGYPHAAVAQSLPGGLLVVDAHVVDFVSGAAMGQPGRVMRVDVPVAPGMSGGPVLDQAGRLAGIIFAVQSPTNDTLAIPVSVLRTLLDGSLPGRSPGCGG